ncbi:MAG: Lrp/AsnC family transcriptional regulator [Firmicutes bacterium]|nr:Lrp/AsnC family transcriptional regulator [Bacillota bacterium]MBR0104511.1 Lrp/AsnC family transcriptional regulator [Bacillota bacterium]MBR2593449.1 Lrp/AsnC family transcriptional regulator [Bacillota bacterium]
MRTKILELLDRNAKFTVSDIAAILGEKEEDVEAEIRMLENEKVICGYTALINWDRTEKDFVTALIEVRVTPQRGNGFDKIAERIYRFKEVKSVYLISGAYDLLVNIEGRTLKDVAFFVSDKLSTIDSVISTATHFVLKKYKDHGKILVESRIKDERMIIAP